MTTPNLKKPDKQSNNKDTKRSPAENNLAASEVLFRRLFESAKDGILILDAVTGEITEVNHFLEELLGYPKSELLGKKLWEIGLFEDQERSLVAYQELQTNGYVRYKDLPLKTKNGKRQEVEFVSNVYGVNGKKVIQCNIRDITEHKKAENSVRVTNEQLETILDSSPAMIFYKDKENRFINVNEAFAKTNGMSKNEIKGKSLWEIYPREEAENYWKDDMEVITTGKPKLNILEEMHTPQGTRWLQTDKIPYRDSKGEIIGIIGFAVDITERRQAEQKLNQTNESLKMMIRELAERNDEISLLSEMGDSLHTCVSLDEAYRVVARFGVQLFPHTKGVLYTMEVTQNILEAAIEWGGPPVGEQEFAPNECVSLRRGRVNVIDGENPGSTITCQHIGSLVSNYLCAPMIAYGEIQGVLHLRRAEEGSVPTDKASKHFEKNKLGLAGTVADYIGLALANLKLREALREQSIHDPLTGLYNGRYMKEALERELRKTLRDERPLGILMLDIDHFKKFNDSFGHEAGDAVLKSLGSFLKTQFRGSDIPCRYGGEEFLIILPRIPMEECRNRAEKLREEVKLLEVPYGGKALPRISFSVGVSGFPEHGNILEDLLKIADSALYSAKAMGRDRVVVGQSLKKYLLLNKPPDNP